MKKIFFISTLCIFFSCVSEKDKALSYIEKHQVSTLSEFTHWRIQSREPNGAFWMFYSPLVDSLIIDKKNKAYHSIYAYKNNNNNWIFLNNTNRSDSNFISLAKWMNINVNNIKDTLVMLANKYYSLDVMGLQGSLWEYPLLSWLEIEYDDETFTLLYLESGSLIDFYNRYDSLPNVFGEIENDRTDLNKFLPLSSNNWYLESRRE